MITIKIWHKDGENILSSSPTLIPIHTNLLVKFAVEFWFYRCWECGFDAHPYCALGKNHYQARGQLQVCHPSSTPCLSGEGRGFPCMPSFQCAMWWFGFGMYWFQVQFYHPRGKKKVASIHDPNSELEWKFISWTQENIHLQLQLLQFLNHMLLHIPCSLTCLFK